MTRTKWLIAAAVALSVVLPARPVFAAPVLGFVEEIYSDVAPGQFGVKLNVPVAQLPECAAHVFVYIQFASADTGKAAYATFLAALLNGRPVQVEYSHSNSYPNGTLCVIKSWVMLK